MVTRALHGKRRKLVSVAEMNAKLRQLVTDAYAGTLSHDDSLLISAVGIKLIEGGAHR